MKKKKFLLIVPVCLMLVFISTIFIKVIAQTKIEIVDYVYSWRDESAVLYSDNNLYYWGGYSADNDNTKHLIRNDVKKLCIILTMTILPI